jgi:Flp pilus assembly protein CpaB
LLTSQHSKLLVAAWLAASLLLFPSLNRSARGQSQMPSSETTNMIVLVKEADSGQPISQARLTLQFTEPAVIGRGKKISYNAKTDAQGRYKFVGINKGTIVLSVTAVDHQAYGKQLQLEKDDQVFEIKLKKPQPLI